jgi:septal ring factor EnvC (AmiA/AmiB activator)
MEEQRARHTKELMKKDSEREIVSEELDSLAEQYQQLESAFESQSSQLSNSHSEVEQLRRELETKTAELGKLAQQDKERRASFSRVSPLLD